jgi:glycosyltransferase involved in cell wall biosynthesis
MRLIVLVKSTPAHMFGGVETHADLLARSAARLGHDVLVVTTAHPRGITEDRMGGARVVHLAGAPPGVHTRAWWTLSAAAVARRLAEGAVDLVLSLGLSGYGLATANPGVRHYNVAYGDALSHVISEWHEGAGLRGVVGYPRRALGVLRSSWLERRMWRRVDGIVATDDRLHERLRRLGYRPLLAYTGVELEPYRPDPALRQAVRAELGIPPAARVILMTGTVNRQKGMWLAAEIFPALAERRPELHLLVVGDGPGLPDLRRRLATQAGRAHVTGAVPLERVPGYYAASDVFFFPTLRVEGLPFAVIDALAAGLPIVAADRGGVSSAVEHEVTGLLAPPGDRAALRDALARVLDDPALAAALGARARARARERFEVDATTSRLLAELGSEAR